MNFRNSSSIQKLEKSWDFKDSFELIFVWELSCHNPDKRDFRGRCNKMGWRTFFNVYLASLTPTATTTIPLTNITGFLQVMSVQHKICAWMTSWRRRLMTSGCQAFTVIAPDVKLQDRWNTHCGGSLLPCLKVNPILDHCPHPCGLWHFHPFTCSRMEGRKEEVSSLPW